ncbi:MAG: hypothetical protein AAF492_33510, partial [Verrucomicrobiota bacterium]
TGSHFPPRYQEALFILDWAYGRILTLHLTARGAGYHASAETFLRGRPLNVTDLEFGPDGHLYFVTGGRKTQSALYRIRHTGSSSTPPELTEQETARRAFSKQARALRRELETLHGQHNPEAIKTVWPHLDSPDPFIRHAARVALEHQSPELILREIGPLDLAGLTALLACVRTIGDLDLPKLIEKLNIGWDSNPPALTRSRLEKLTLLRCYEIAFQRQPSLVASHGANALKNLSPLYPDPAMPVNREAARLLQRLEAPDFVSKTMALLHRCNDQRDLLHFLNLLKDVQTGWTLEHRRAFFERLGQSHQWYGDRSMANFIKTLHRKARATLNEEE